MARTYQMTPAQSDDWILGGAAAHQVEVEIDGDMQDVEHSDDVDVVLDDGSVAWTIWRRR